MINKNINFDEIFLKILKKYFETTTALTSKKTRIS